jgi:hypothetical protein
MAFVSIANASSEGADANAVVNKAVTTGSAPVNRDQPRHIPAAAT